MTSQQEVETEILRNRKRVEDYEGGSDEHCRTNHHPTPRYPPPGPHPSHPTHPRNTQVVSGAVVLLGPEWQIGRQRETEGSCDRTVVEVEGWDSGSGGRGRSRGRTEGDTPSENRSDLL